jgi:predicted phage baseplate assembly protein
LNFFGTYAQVQTLVDRTLILQKGETTQRVQVTSPAASFALAGRDETHPWLWPVTLDQQPSFPQEDFDEQTAAVTVYGNLVGANQGKAEKDTILGNGDSRQIFQTFKLPKAPLTYFTASSETPPEVPELDIYINERRWQRVPSLFDQDPQAEIYIVREDAAGNSWVQFGDGKTGARLPSGLNNIKAKYRTGIGAYGAQQDGTTIQGGKLDRLDKVWLPGVVSGGSQPETGENAREAAPGKIQSLGRLVSLQDFETETLAISGVSKVSAAWELVDNVPAVVLTVLMESGRELEIENLRGILTRYNRCRGPQRFPIIVRPGALKFIYVDLTLSLSPLYQTDGVTAAVKTALGVTENGIDGSQGLLGLHQRQFGQPEYATRIEGMAQNVTGVVWTKVTALGWLLGSGTDPLALTLPPEPKPLNLVLSSAPDQIFSLQPMHLSLNVSTAPAEEVC